jgi:hypothetical protein
MAATDEELLSSLRKFVLSAHAPPPPVRKELPAGRSLAGLVLLAAALALGSLLLEQSYSPVLKALGTVAPFLFGASLVALLEEARKSIAAACGHPVVFTVIAAFFLVVGSLWWISVGKTQIPVRVSPTALILVGKDTLKFVEPQRRSIVLPGLRRDTLTIYRSVPSETEPIDLVDAVEVGPLDRIRASGLVTFLWGKHTLDLMGTQLVDFDFGEGAQNARAVRIEGWFPASYSARHRDVYEITFFKRKKAHGETRDSLSIVRTFGDGESSVRIPEGKYEFHLTDSGCKKGRTPWPLIVDGTSRIVPVVEIPCPTEA